MKERPERVTRTYLEMLAPGALSPARVPDPAPTIERLLPPSGHASRELYRAVGRAHWWTDRQDWPLEHWDRWAERVQTWIGYVDGERIGYGELNPHDREVELAYFGLLSGWRGRGYGGHLLTEITRRAWSIPGTRRIWLSTGTLDSDAALPGYLKRGYTVFARREEPPPAPRRED
jgi:GNAT superfamily N-acetyltransferase